MLPVAPARSLWWLARWAARLLTGFAVAAAFTVGAWAMPASAGPAGQPDTAASGRFDAASGRPAVTVAPQAHTGWQPAALYAPVDHLAQGVTAGTDLDVAIAVPPAVPTPLRPSTTGGPAAPVASAFPVLAPGADPARGPPRS
ncbi:hypothetical protein ACQPYA_10180 [Micromonospora sp. CA-263727]|uniref:hypothetical protein n=1 Tax=Micromonospora sp. CA-263727 TaxID=3239967 RepID=UPI003D92A03A